MDWLKKTLGAVGNFFGGAVNQGVKTAERYVPGYRQAEQAVTRFIPRQQQQQPQRSAPIQLPQIPHVNIQDVARAIGDTGYNLGKGIVTSFTDPIVHSIGDVPKVAQASYYTVKGLPEFSRLYDQNFRLMKGNPYNPLDWVKAINPPGSVNRPLSEINPDMAKSESLQHATNFYQSNLAPIDASIERGKGKPLDEALVELAKGTGQGLANAGLQYGTYATLPLGGSVVKGAVGQSLGTQIAKGAGTGAAYGAGFGALQPISQGNYNLKDIGVSAAQNAALAAVLGGSIPVGVKGVKAGVGYLKSPQAMRPGFVAGPASPLYWENKAAGKVFKGVDNKPKFEVSDSAAKIKVNEATIPGGLRPGVNLVKVGDVLEHKALYKNYPQLKNVDLNVELNPKLKRSGVTVPNGDGTFTITVQAPSKAAIKPTLLHEIQHNIQEIEGFAKGSAMRNGQYGKYAQAAGEAEARNVAGRMNMSEAQRLKLPFNKTFDVAPQNQLVAFGKGKIQASIPKNLEQEIKKLEAYGWSKADINAYKEAVLNPTKTKSLVDNKPNYGMSHRPTDTGSISDLTKSKIAPKDIYDNPAQYGADRETIAALKKAKGNPNAEVTLYRATPKNELNHGDWVTLSKNYAKQEAAKEGVPVHSFKAKARDVSWAGDNLNELGYFPKTGAQSVELPKGFKLNKNGDVINIKTGKVATPRDLESAQAGHTLSNQEIINFDQQNANKLSGAKVVGNKYEAQNVRDLQAQGWKVDPRGKRLGLQDEGIDNVAYKNGKTLLVQDKGWNTAYKEQIKYFYTSVEAYKASHPNEKVIARFRTSAKEIPADAQAFAKSNGIQIEQVAREGFTPPVSSPLEGTKDYARAVAMLGETNVKRIMNGIPVENRTQFLRDVQNTRKGVGKALTTVKPEEQYAMAVDWYKSFNPRGTYELSSLKGMSSKIANAKDAQGVRSAVSEAIAQNKQLQGTNPAWLNKLNNQLKDDQFAKSLAEKTNQSEIRKAIGPGVYEPFVTKNQANVQALDKIVAQLPNGQMEKPFLGGPSVLKNRSLPATARESASLPQSFRDTINNMQYRVVPNKETLSKAYLETNQNFTKAVEDVKNMTLKNGLQKTLGLGGRTPDSHEVAKAMIVVDRLTRENNYTTANEVLQSLSKQSTELGRAVQLFSVYNRTSPAGIGNYAHSVVEKYNKLTGKDLKVTDSQLQSFTEQAKLLERMKPGHDKDIATAKLMRQVEALTPAKWQDKLQMSLYLSQLLFPKTAIRNVVGNGIMLVGEDISHLIGAPVDAVTSFIVRKPREVYAPNIIKQTRDLWKGLRVGIGEARQGVDLRDISHGKYDVNPGTFRGPIGSRLEKALAIELTAFDRAFYESAKAQMVRDLTKGAQRAKGKAAKYVMSPQEIQERADYFGKYMTYQDDSSLAKLALDFKHGLNKITSGSESFGLGSAVINYPKTPSNLILRGVDYSPLGYVRVLADIAKPMILRQGFNKQKFVQDFARATTGSGSLVGMGAFLYNLGIVTPGQKDQNKDVTAFQKEIGTGRYKINYDGLKRYIFSGFDPDEAKPREGDNLVSYDWAQPLAIPFSAGAEIAQQMKAKNLSANRRLAAVGDVGSQVVEGIQTIGDQPLLQGVQKMFGTGNMSQGLLNTVQGMPASFVPSALRGVRNITDNTTRETYSPNFFQGALNQVMNSIPGVASALPARYNTFGDTAENYQNGSNNVFNVAFNPAFFSKYQTNPTTGELARLYDKSGNNAVLPNVVNKTYTVNGRDVILGGEDMSRMQQYMGLKANGLLNELFNTNYYKSLDDTGKENAITSVLNNITAAAKIDVLGDAPEKVPVAVQNIRNGILPPNAITPKLKLAKGKKAKKTSKGRKGGGSKVAKSKLPKFAAVKKAGTAPKGVLKIAVKSKTSGPSKITLKRTRSLA